MFSRVCVVPGKRQYLHLLIPHTPALARAGVDTWTLSAIRLRWTNVSMRFYGFSSSLMRCYFCNLGWVSCYLRASLSSSPEFAGLYVSCFVCPYELSFLSPAPPPNLNILFFFFLAAQHMCGMQDLSFPVRDRTPAPCIGSMYTEWDMTEAT